MTGALSLDSTYVSIWAGTNFAIQVIFQCISPLTADRFGLKPNMFAFTLLMVIVSSITRTSSSDSDNDWAALGNRPGDHIQRLESLSGIQNFLRDGCRVHWYQYHDVHLGNHDPSDAGRTFVCICVLFRRRSASGSGWLRNPSAGQSFEHQSMHLFIYGSFIPPQTAPLAFRNAFYSEFALLGVWLPILIFLPESPCK